MPRVLCLATVALASFAFAQPARNRVERAKDRQDLRQDRRQLVDDRLDTQRAAQLLRDFDAAAPVGDVARLGVIDQAFNAHLVREIAESKVESAQARQEVREDKRELRGDRRELRSDVGKGPAAVADDVHDKRRDAVNLADDRADAVKERLSRERLLAIQAQLGSLAGRFDAPSLTVKRQLYGEVVAAAVREVAGDQQERSEDKRELREDRRERREDRR